MEDLELFLKRNDEILFQICKNKQIKKKLEKIYKIGVRFNLRKVEIIYLLKAVVEILDGTESIDIAELYGLGE